jgi:hypothetical protein
MSLPSSFPCAAAFMAASGSKAQALLACSDGLRALDPQQTWAASRELAIRVFPRFATQSALAPAALTTLAHFSASVTTIRRKRAGRVVIRVRRAGASNPTAALFEADAKTRSALGEVRFELGLQHSNFFRGSPTTCGYIGNIAVAGSVGRPARDVALISVITKPRRDYLLEQAAKVRNGRIDEPYSAAPITACRLESSSPIWLRIHAAVPR